MIGSPPSTDSSTAAVDGVKDGSFGNAPPRGASLAEFARFRGCEQEESDLSRARFLGEVFSSFKLTDRLLRRDDFSSDFNRKIGRGMGEQVFPTNSRAIKNQQTSRTYRSHDAVSDGQRWTVSSMKSTSPPTWGPPMRWADLESPRDHHSKFRLKTVSDTAGKTGSFLRPQQEYIPGEARSESLSCSIKPLKSIPGL